MKKCIFFILISLIMLSCQSNEKKVINLIENELSKTLYDIDSYSPIETIVVKAKQTIYNDTSVWSYADTMFFLYNRGKKMQKEADEAKENMYIWGPPTAYSSLYSDRKYKTYKEEYDRKKNALELNLDLLKIMAETFNDTIQTLDNNKIIGWEATHKFRCKTKGGYSTICNCRYVIDEKIENILIFEDLDDDESQEKRNLIEAIINGLYQ